MIQEETLNSVGNRQYEKPEGELLHFIESGNSTITVLTRVEEPAIESPPFNPPDITVSELEERLGDNAYDWNKRCLKGLLEAEENGKDRKTAKSLIQDQLKDSS